MTAIRDTTRNLVETIWADEWPRDGAVVDFGIKSQAHDEALYYGLRDGQITPEQLDAAMGNGRALTELVNAAPHNAHKDIAFRTDWDGLRPEPRRDGEQSPVTSAGEIADSPPPSRSNVRKAERSPGR
jgi:hypothetical protein